jgi:cytochrome P450
MTSLEAEPLPVPTTSGIGSLVDTFDKPPYEYYERLRQRGDVVWDEEEGVWLVTSYAAMRELVLRDKELWRDPFGLADPEYPVFETTPEQWIDYTGGPRVLTQVDAELHSRTHRWWMAAFSPKVLAQWGETLVDPIVRSTIAEVAPHGKANFGDEVAQVVTLRSVAAVLGLPDDMPRLQQFSEVGLRLLAIFTGALDHLDANRVAATPESVEMSMEGSREFQAMIMERVLAKKRSAGAATEGYGGEPGLDFISLAWGAGESLFGPEEATAEYVCGHAFHAVIAAMESINGAARNGFYLLATHPELHDRIRDDQQAANNFVEEVLRLHGSVEFRPRRATQDLELRGVPIQKGQTAILVIGCANRDPEHYPDPYKIDLDRRAPRDHFGFLQGPRTCAGQNLARFLLQRYFRPTLQQLDGLRLDPDAAPPQYRGTLARRWDPLHFVFTPRT